MLLAFAARADELTLKDGTKIGGTIVGFEENSFKVKTSYGFAVVLKEQVASITIGTTGTMGTVGVDAKTSPGAAAAKADAAASAPPALLTPPALAPAGDAAKPANAARASAAANAATSSAGSAPSTLAASAAKPVDASKLNVASAVAAPPSPVITPVVSVTPVKQPAPEAKAPVAASTLDGKPAKPETANTAAGTPKSSVGSNAAAGAVAPTRVAAPVTAPMTVAAAAPKPAGAAPAPAVAAVSAVEPIREQVVGNTYTNATYGFQMYKPPTWEVIAGVPSVLPGAIAAMGTNDQTTYLLVGQEAGGSSVAAVKDATERRLRDITDNFRALGESSVAISGGRATEFRFRGGVDGHDWSGVAVFVPHGVRIFTIFGMTLADSDLVQIQENVIERAISSLQFTK
jgi:hypothetical protein